MENEATASETGLKCFAGIQGRNSLVYGSICKAQNFSVKKK